MPAPRRSARGSAGAAHSGSALAGQRGGDEVGGERREQDAVAVVAGRPQRARRARPGRSPAGCRASPGRRPATQLLDLELEHAGHDLAHVAQQLVDAAGGRRGVEAALLHRRAEDVAAVRARDEVGVAAADVRSTRPGPRGSRSRRIWPLTGRTGTRALGGPRARPRAPAASTTCAGARRPRRRPAAGPSTRSPSASTAATRARRTCRRRARTASASAATSRRGSTEWSPGTSSARRTVGASAGSARRAWLGRSRSTSRPSSRRNASSRSSASASSRSRATSSVPVAR